MQERTSLTFRRLCIGMCALTLGLLLALLTYAPTHAQDNGPTGSDDLTSPDDCAACHEGEYNSWHDSQHANAMTDPAFIEAYARAGSPSYCFSCHATGYDPVAGTTQYDGVACLSCHTPTNQIGVPHMTVDDSSALCGTCHSGPHAPDYDEWIVSGHATMGIDCVDCHQSHSAKIRMDDPTQLCISCHTIEGDSDLHGTEGMACHDCHMYQGSEVVDTLSGRKESTGHTFSIPAAVCASCHGMTHTLTTADETVQATPTPDLSSQLADMEDQASSNLNLGLTGGGIGGLVVGVSIPFLLRRKGRK